MLGKMQRRALVGLASGDSIGIGNACTFETPDDCKITSRMMSGLVDRGWATVTAAGCSRGKPTWIARITDAGLDVLKG